MSLPIVPAARDLFFQGRSGDPRLGEWVQAVTAATPPSDDKHHVVLFGNPDDEGVARNRGRRGAAAGPDSIRRHLYKMSPPADFLWEEHLSLSDLGNIIVRPKISETHAHTATVTESIARSGSTILALGGGNDFTAPGFRGFAKACRGPCGIINVDPHLDTRPLEDGLPHSGTPYRQLVDDKTVAGSSVVEFGARPSRNSRASWQYCRKQKIKIVPFEKLRASSVAATFRAALTGLSRRCESVGVSIDIDCCSEGEGTSAAPVLGLVAWELIQIAQLAGRQSKVRYFELVEVAPSLDPTERSSRIAAETIYAFLRARAELKRC